MSKAEVESSFTFAVLGEENLLWRMEGQALVGLYASTEHLTSGRLTLAPGHKSDVRRHGGDLAAYVVEGTLDAVTFQEGQKQSFILSPRDGLFVPEGANYQLFNMSNEPVVLIFGVAPQYLPD